LSYNPRGRKPRFRNTQNRSVDGVVKVMGHDARTHSFIPSRVRDGRARHTTTCVTRRASRDGRCARRWKARRERSPARSSSAGRRDRTRTCSNSRARSRVVGSGARSRGRVGARARRCIRRRIGG